MIICKDKGFETRSDKPNEDWTGEALCVVADGTELANKIQRLYPHYDVVLNKNGNLIDVVEIKKPEPTQEELKKQYDVLAVQYIHEKYSYDDENKIMREYLSDQANTDYKSAFDTYNTYVLECKTKAHKEVYGN